MRSLFGIWIKIELNTLRFTMKSCDSGSLIKPFRLYLSLFDAALLSLSWKMKKEKICVNLKSAWTCHLEFYSDYIVILFYCIFAVKWFLLYKCNVCIHIKYADVEQIHEICGTQGNTFSYCINTFISSKKCFLSALRHLRNNDSFLGI